MPAVPLPAGCHSINPYFVVSGVERFIDFLVEVLEGVEVGDRELRGDGAVDHADVALLVYFGRHACRLRGWWTQTAAGTVPHGGPVHHLGEVVSYGA